MSAFSAVSDGGSEPLERRSDELVATPAAAATAVTALGGTARVFAHTARGLALDLVSAAARAGEVAVDLVGRHRDPNGGSGTSVGSVASAGSVATPRGTVGAGRQGAGLSTLRVDVLILSDEHGVPLTTPDRLGPALRLAERVFSERAGIRVRCVSIRAVAAPAPRAALDPHADRGLLRDEILGRIAFYRDHLPARDPLSVVGDSVTVIVVRTIAGRATGCSLGMTADWVVVQSSLFDAENPHTYDETVLAHELGHALNLPHHRDPGNLMHGVSSPPGEVRGTGLAGWQAALLQANRHTIPPARPSRPPR